MKKYFIIAILLSSCLSRSFGQVTPDSITQAKQRLAHAGSDTARVRLLLVVGGAYRFSKIDSTLYFDDRAIALARKVNAPVLEARALSDKGSVTMDAGDVPHAYAYMIQSLNIINKVQKVDSISLYTAGAIQNRLGNLFMELGEYNAAIRYYRASIFYAVKCSSPIVYNEFSNIGNVFEMMGRLDSAQVYQRRAYNHINSIAKRGYRAYFFVFAELEGRLANIERDLGHNQAALDWYRKGVREAIRTSDSHNLSEICLNAGQIFGKLGQADSGFYYVRKALLVSQSISKKSTEYQAASLLSDLFKASGKPDSALFYLSLSQKVKDELFGPATFRQLQQLALAQQQRQQQLQEQNDELKYRYTIFAVVGGLVVILLIAVIIWRNYRKQKNTNLLLREQKEEIVSQRDHLGVALEQLKSTQTQLIQSEKMASLGELTAGIAHEIQNPLNFVNNFSEVNAELIDEMQQEIEKGDLTEIKVIAGDIKENQQKISHHGKRADAIVKGMLQHSRAGGSTKEPTDINKLADEYLRLAYHGLRAKDKTFNAELITHFDEKLPNANIVPQDIGRVLVNLFTNAFYAVHQKAKTAGPGYKPEVSVSTTKEENNIVITVKDNGNGIPDNIKDKIMQPFFTTKPTGEGTGLGLSLSYDIVVKGHGGTIAINSNEGESSEFIINLPVS
ncbi:MAG: ATP-binding protein [Sphingobacteriales bacterium]